MKKLIENINDMRKSLNEISVYDLNVYSAIELYYKLALKTNEVITELSRFEGVISDEIIEQNEKLTYLLGEGLNIEVVKKINQMVADGTMDTIINHNVFNSLNNKIEDYKNELSSQIKDNYTKPSEVKLVFQYNNKDNIEKIRKIKSLGLNTVILPKILDWQKNVDEVKKFINLHKKYGISVILELNTNKLKSDDYQSELDWIKSFNDCENLIGLYSIDEPVINKMSIETQELIYSRIKSVTNKDVYISDVAFLDSRTDLFKQYYTPHAFDYYILNNYIAHETNRDTIINTIIGCYTNFSKNSLITPKNIIPNFPVFTDGGYTSTLTKQTLQYHIDGYSQFYEGSYALFAFDDLAIPYSSNLPLGLVKVIDNDTHLFNIAKRINTLIKRNDNKTTKYFNVPIDSSKGVSKFYKIETKEGIKFGGGNTLAKYILFPTTVNVGIVNSKSIKVVDISNSNVNTLDFIHCTPLDIDNNAMVTYQAFCRVDGEIKLRIINHGDQQINLGNNTWFFDIFKR